MIGTKHEGKSSSMDKISQAKRKANLKGRRNSWKLDFSSTTLAAIRQSNVKYKLLRK